jgi:F420-non-reducing hydrogenase iron-sulfur subunit
MKYPPNLVPIRVMCSGRVDPTFVLKALKEGADGVLIAGCHPGDCHYTSGNFRALGRYTLLQAMLDQLGIDRERVKLEWVSASEGEKWAKTVKEITEGVRKLGPLNWNGVVEQTKQEVAKCSDEVVKV